MKNKSYPMRFLRNWLLCLIVIFSVNLSFATNPTEPTDPDPCAKDKQAPTIKCPRDIVDAWAKCNEKCASITFPEPTASDNCDKNPKVWCEYPSGYCFPLGTTEVWCWAKDKAGNESKCSFNVTVKLMDAVPPTIKCPADIVDAWAGCKDKCTPIAYVGPTATDNCDPNPKVTCDFPSGYCFPIGTTVVTCTAKDQSDNISKCSFKLTVMVKDMVKPTIVCPRDVVVDLPCNSSATCAKAVFDLPKATDDCDPNPKITCNYQSGDCFPVGTTTVTCTAVDAFGNQATCTFKVTVSKKDNTPPVISNCPRDIDLYAECGSMCTNLMARMTPDAKDDCDPNPRIWCEANGKEVNMRSCFMIGKTTVICYAQDNAGNRSSCSYVVTTKFKDDYVPPVISCPRDLMYSLSDSETKLNKMCRTVDLPGVTATDNCSTPTITCSIWNGTAQVTIDKNFCFMLGKTRVTCTARDAAGNTSSCGFWVTIMRFGDKIAAIQDNNTAVAGPKGEKNVSISGESTPSDLNLTASQRLLRKEFAVYPNPTANTVNLELQQYSGKDVSIQLLNSFGQQVYNTTFKEVTDQAYRIDMQNYPTGMYFIKVTSDGVETSAKKVLKE
jgi:HYR domain/Secretion system C-terminal sorting domain